MGFLGIVALYVAANADGPCRGELTLEQGSQDDDGNSEPTQRKHARQKADQTKNC